jgi:hypothetical protein
VLNGRASNWHPLPAFFPDSLSSESIWLDRMIDSKFFAGMSIPIAKRENGAKSLTGNGNTAMLARWN